MTRTILIAAVACAAAAPLAAQQPAPRSDRVGHIVAVVGDSAILNFDIQEGILARQAVLQREIVPGSAEYDELAREILETRINDLVIIQAALRDTTIQVLEDLVERRVQQKVEEDQRQVGGPAGLEQALRESGLTMLSYRERLSTQYRKQALMEQYIGRAVRERRPPPVTERELRELYDEIGEQFGERPPTVTFQQVLVRTQPSAAALAEARARADSVFALIRAGGNFEQLARQHSDDPSRESGGDLGWSRRGEWVREFSNVAFALRPGQVSSPVRTQYGYHLIKAERSRGAEMQLRHILFRPELTIDDAFRARARADSVADLLRAGGDANALARQYGDPDAPVRVGPSEHEPIQQRFGVDPSQTTPGQVLGPVPVGGDDIASEFLVLRILEVEEARPWSIDDPVLRERLRQEYQNQKLTMEIVEDLRRSTYVEIRGF
jgi:peptidyl-prolyl cis-trans isomerase SurA